MKRLVGMVAGAAALLGAVTAQAQSTAEPDLLSVGVGVFDVLRERDRAAEFMLQYRSGHRLWLLQPHGGLAATSDGSVYGFAGLLLDLPLGEHLVLTPSAAVGGYHAGGGRDLGHGVQFRTGAELAWRFADRSRLGVGFYHTSNAGLGRDNPGAESVLATYSLPLSRLIGN